MIKLIGKSVLIGAAFLIPSLLQAQATAPRQDTGGKSGASTPATSPGGATSSPAAPTQGAGTATSQPGATGKLTAADHRFVVEAAQGGMAEVAKGRLAVQKASDPAVKQLGQHIVDDHTKANEELIRIAASKGVTPPATLDAEHNAQINQLETQSKDFDAVYIKDQIKDHEKTIQLFEREVREGKDADLKAFAQKTLPTLKEHLKMVRSTGQAHAAGKTGGKGEMGKMGDGTKEGKESMRKDSSKPEGGESKSQR